LRHRRGPQGPRRPRQGLDPASRQRVHRRDPVIRQLAATIEVGAYEQTGGRDEAGDYVPRFVSRAVRVYGIHPSTAAAPEERNRSPGVTAWDIYAPPGPRVGPHDVVRIPDVAADLQVKGEPAIWEMNPYGTQMGNTGVVLKVEKADG